MSVLEMNQSLGRQTLIGTLLVFKTCYVVSHTFKIWMIDPLSMRRASTGHWIQDHLPGFLWTCTRLLSEGQSGAGDTAVPCWGADKEICKIEQDVRRRYW